MARKDNKTAEPEWLTRVKEERLRLSERLRKLKDFLAKTPSPAKMSAAHKILLRKQCQAMQDYHDILVVRISLAEKEQQRR